MSHPESLPFVRFARLQETVWFSYSMMPYDHRLVYCADGTGKVRVAGQEYLLQPGSLLLWRGGVPYRYLSWEMKGIFLNFDVTGKHSEKTTPIPPARTAHFDPSRLLEPTEEADFLPQVLYLPHAEGVHTDLKRILEEYTCKRLGYEAVCGALLYGVLTLCRRIHRLGSPEHTPDPAEEILHYIQQYLESPLTYDIVGKQFHYHPNHVNRLIKERTGMSFHQYIRSCRMEQAIHLLQTTPLSVGEIATRLQFADVKSFSRCFKLATGNTPSFYRSVKK